MFKCGDKVIILVGAYSGQVGTIVSFVWDWDEAMEEKWYYYDVLLSSGLTVCDIEDSELSPVQ